MIRIILAGLGAAVFAAASAEPPWVFHQMSQGEISKALERIHKEHASFADRIAAVSERFLGAPYRFDPMGEGPDGEFDADPISNFKEVDCTTMIEQAMALSLEPSLPQAVKILQKIRYKNGRVAFEARNHFPEIDWIANNAAAGYLRDATREIAGDKAKTARKLISKRAWLASLSSGAIRGFPDVAGPEKERRLARLKKIAEAFTDEVSELPYLPVELLPDFLAEIPSGTIANLVRADVPEQGQHVSHQVLIIDKGGAKFVRHAAYKKSVEDVPALAYFYRYFHSRWPLLGLNFNQPLSK